MTCWGGGGGRLRQRQECRATNLWKAGALCQVLKVAFERGEEADIVLGLGAQAAQLRQTILKVLQLLRPKLLQHFDRVLNGGGDCCLEHIQTDLVRT